MCLVIGVLLAILSVNFYLNGFVLQAAIAGVLSLVLISFMIRNVGCPNGACKPKIKDKKEEETDDN